ncbi:MAG TPA: hypothetical protein VGK99_14330 [Acidobacteriota bacterium]|jgi:hypothetical protein
MKSKWGSATLSGSGVSLVVLGVIFLALGVSGRQAFLGVGAGFLIGGLALLVLQGRSGSSK